MSDEVTEIIPDADVDRVWGNANFGSMTKRDVIKYGLLKCACGYYQGFTSKSIITELGLISEKYELTAKGRLYLWAAFNDSNL